MAPLENTMAREEQNLNHSNGDFAGSTARYTWLEGLSRVSGNHQGEVFCLSPSSFTAASFSYTEPDIKLWEISPFETTEPGRKISARTKRRFLAISPTGTQFAAPILGLDHIHVWNVSEHAGKGFSPHFIIDYSGEAIETLRFSNTGKHLCLLTSRYYRLWDATAGDLILKGGVSLLQTKIILSHDWGLLAATCHSLESGAVEIWDTATKKVVASLESDPVIPRALAFSHNTEYLAVGFEDHVDIWDLTSFTISKTLRVTRPVASLQPWATPEDVIVFSPDGTFSTNGTQLATAHAWSAAVWDLSRAPNTSADNSEDDEPAPLALDESSCVESNPTNWAAFYAQDRLEYNDQRGYFQATTRYGTFFLERCARKLNGLWYQFRKPGHAVSEDGKWIIKDGEKMMWLPPDYRCLGADDDFVERGPPSWVMAEGVLIIETKAKGFMVMELK
ncbi:hypothetical protein OQA88_3042 [Cercophora sp. LCS_1]